MDKLRNSLPPVLLEMEEKQKKERSKNARSSNGAVIWGRVSSADQDEDGFSKDAQVRYLRKYASREGLAVVREFAPVESAFQETDRDTFDEMVAFVRSSKKVRHILVEKTDRLHRSEQRKMKIKELVDKYGIRVHFVKEGRVYSRDSRSHEMFGYNINSAVSNYYSQVVGEEASKGMREKAEQGIYPSFAPLGYLNEDKGIAIDKERAPLIKKLFEVYGTGNHSLKETARIARDLGLTYRGSGGLISKSTLGDILKNSIYTGWFMWKGKLHHGSHEPIVSMEMFERVQNVFKGRNATKPQCTARVFAYSQLIKCAKCGCSIVGERKKEKYTYYHCSGYSGGRKISSCGRKYVREEVVERQFTEILGQLQIDSGIFEQICKALRASHSDIRQERDDAIHGLQADHDKLQNRIDLMYEDKLDGKVSDDYFTRVSRHWREEQARILDEIAAHQNSDQSCMEDGIRLLQLGTNAQSVLGRQDDFGKRGLLKLLLWNPIWDDGKVSATFRRPFDILAQTKIAVDSVMAENPQNENWLPGPDSNQRHGG